MRVRPFTGTFYGTSAFSDSQTVPTSKRGLLYLGRILTVDSEICGKCGTIVETCEPTISKRKQAELSISKKNIMFFWFKDSESMGMRQSPLPERTLCSFLCRGTIHQLGSTSTLPNKNRGIVLGTLGDPRGQTVNLTETQE